ncbi:MAG: Rpn family recombination-promoting nuclease/putative transposase [Phascolarctobacterium sp.]|uniref:Rpn family recombination-promoting nuclease/putative transposase n=1 Tax=Phascolarctobacterium sp. TaxID=2049039 RepID=UPI0026DD8D4F|nr:Rpn family recombination-promoting nuclease/putative transposase [Phascolarctobacterium sp.]MDO4921590.1 Rpn family recombination-promoting nuclease/putative transposase [Phascolarctobacterium sp.]
MNAFTADSLLIHKEILLAKIKTMNLFHNTFISVVFKDEGACLHLIRVLMNNPTLKIIQFRSQNNIPQLISHGAQLDVIAEDENGKIYEIEIQRLEEVAPARRMRFYASVIDSELLRKGVNYNQLPEVYLFYITREDIWAQGQTIYEVRQILSSANCNLPYDNGLHTIFINAEINDGSKIAQLMQYFKTAKAGDFSQGALSDYINLLKSPEGGRKIMDEFMKEFAEYYHDAGYKEGESRGEAQATLDIAKNMKRLGNFSDEAIVLATKLSLEQVKAIRV